MAKAPKLELADQVSFGYTDGKTNKSHKAIMAFATQYKPREVNGYKVHNTFFTPYTVLPKAVDIATEFKRLTDLGAFNVITNPKTGLIQTSETENVEMTKQWFTDSAMAGFIQRTTDPAGWRKSMVTNAAALNTKEALEAVEKTVKDPNWYRKGDIMNGVFHIYYPSSVHLDKQGIPMPEKIKLDNKWFNQKRLESQALMLLNLVDTIEAGFVQGKQKEWGFKPKEMDSKAGQYVTNAIGKMAQYLLSANTDPDKGQFNFETPTSSSWEEAPFKEGMTSDTALTVMAMERLKRILFDSHNNQSAQLNKIKNDILSASGGLTKEKLDNFIQLGRAFVAKRIIEPLEAGQSPVQTPSRPYDTSLSILAASCYRFYPDDLLKDAATRLELVTKNKQALLGENGMRRYNAFKLDGVDLHDSYLNRAYHFPEEVRLELFNLKKQGEQKKYGSSDASSVEAMADRQKISSENTVAEWGLGLSASLQALSQAKLDVLESIKNKKASQQDAEKLLSKIDVELVDVLNRNLAAIPGPLKSGQKILRADGTLLKPYLPMEAYEAVPDNNGNIKYIPGAHTLPWHASQLYDGLTKLYQAQKQQEALS